MQHAILGLWQPNLGLNLGLNLLALVTLLPQAVRHTGGMVSLSDELELELELITSPLIGLPHAFSTRSLKSLNRLGGDGAFAGLNLGEPDRGDESARVADNRRLLAEALGYQASEIVRVQQVHGTEVLTATAGEYSGKGDALVTNNPNFLLAISTADCYPLLLADEEAGVIGAAHAGWRGTVGKIGAKTVLAMQQLGARPERIKAAIGVGICAEHYPVGDEVRQAFVAAGLGECIGQDGHADLARANALVLGEAGILEEHIWQAGRCSTEADFYSYRRDDGVTGRMWALIGLRQAGGQR